MPALNNVATSSKAIEKMCPELISYFASGVRMNMYELALLHAAARAQRVYVRGEQTVLLERQPDETPESFLSRVRTRDGTPTECEHLADNEGVTAALLHGDLELDSETPRYVVFPGVVTGNLSASDWLI